MTTMNYDGTNADEMMRAARTDRSKVLRFVGEFDGTADDGDPMTCYMAYRDDGWPSWMSTGHELGRTPEEAVKPSFEVYNHVELIDAADTPDYVDL